MESINDFIEWTGFLPSLSYPGVELLKDLDKNLPKIYSFESKEAINLARALGQLDAELVDSRKYTNYTVLIQTKKEKDLQKLLIYHNGKKVPRESLMEINKKLKKIANGKIEWRSYRHGNLIAAQNVKELGGRIYLENLRGNYYKVKTTIELPLKSE